MTIISINGQTYRIDEHTTIDIYINKEKKADGLSGVVTVKIEGDPADVNSYLNVNVSGDVKGNAKSGTDMVVRGNVFGDARSGTDMKVSGNVSGNVQSGTDTSCGNVGGDVKAGMNVECGDVSGNAKAGMNLSKRG